MAGLFAENLNFGGRFLKPEVLLFAGKLGLGSVD
jgi:hypothetical protein